MPTIEQNVKNWETDYEWAKAGEEWSSAWGGAEAQWSGCIFPRIRQFLPTGTILEIAPGFGRWTNYLREHAEQLIAVDLAENCIEVCRKRFADADNMTFHVNDGRSLSMVPDNTIDFVFSFDSLVHAEAEVIRDYLAQFEKKLKPNGVGFIHHSNIGSYRREFALGQRLPSKIRHGFMRMGILERTHWRAFSMTAARFEEYCEEVGLQCFRQELVNWGSRKLIDCFSLFTPKGSIFAQPNTIQENPNFMQEARDIKERAQLKGSE